MKFNLLYNISALLDATIHSHDEDSIYRRTQTMWVELSKLGQLDDIVRIESTKQQIN